MRRLEVEAEPELRRQVRVRDQLGVVRELDRQVYLAERHAHRVHDGDARRQPLHLDGDHRVAVIQSQPRGDVLVLGHPGHRDQARNARETGEVHPLPHRQQLDRPAARPLEPDRDHIDRVREKFSADAVARADFGQRHPHRAARARGTASRARLVRVVRRDDDAAALAAARQSEQAREAQRFT